MQTPESIYKEEGDMKKTIFKYWSESFKRRWRLHVMMWRGVKVDPAPGALWEIYALLLIIMMALSLVL